VPLVAQERTDAPVNQEAPDPPEFPAAHQQTASRPPHHHADHAPLDHPDLKDQTDLQVTTDPTANQAAQAKKEHQEHQVQLAHQAQPETTETTVQLETEERMDPKKPKSLESRDQLEMMVVLDPKALLETQVPMVLLVNPGPKDHLDLLVQTAMPELLAKMVKLVTQVQLVTRVFVRNIALWMAAFSLKMAPKAKHQL